MTPLTDKPIIYQNTRPYIVFAVLSFLTSLTTVAIVSYIASHTGTSSPSPIVPTYGFVDNSEKTATLIASSQHHQVYELSKNAQQVGVRHRYIDNNGHYCYVDFITGDINVIPFAGELSNNLRQYTELTLSSGEKMVLIPDNYVEYSRFTNSTQQETHILYVIYDGTITTLFVNRNSNGGLNGISLNTLPPTIQSFLERFNNVMSYARNDAPMVQASQVNVNPVCVIMKCGISGAIDIATCAVEITGSAGTFGWVICAGQSVLAGCNCLECWGYCNMG